MHVTASSHTQKKGSIVLLKALGISSKAAIYWHQTECCTEDTDVVKQHPVTDKVIVTLSLE